MWLIFESGAGLKNHLRVSQFLDNMIKTKKEVVVYETAGTPTLFTKLLLSKAAAENPNVVFICNYDADAAGYRSSHALQQGSEHRYIYMNELTTIPRIIRLSVLPFQLTNRTQDH